VNGKWKNSIQREKAQKGPFLQFWAGAKSGKEVIAFFQLSTPLKQFKLQSFVMLQTLRQ